VALHLHWQCSAVPQQLIHIHLPLALRLVGGWPTMLQLWRHAAARNSFSLLSRRLATAAAAPRERVKLTFIGKKDERIEVSAIVGDSLLDVSQANGIDVEGACGGSCACSTCHMIFEPAVFAALPKTLDEEEDTLELAAGLTPTYVKTRGCRVTVHGVSSVHRFTWRICLTRF
jgi:ferredoxin